jgi:chromate transporter
MLRKLASEPESMAVNGMQPSSRAGVSPGELLLAFLRLGLTAFGGPAMVAYIRELAVKQKDWVSEESFRDGVALCQSIPGATAMQTAAYTGFRAGGIRGAVAAFIGFGLPAFVLMAALSAGYQEVRDYRVIASVFRGLQAIVVALTANATLSFGRATLHNWRDGLLAAGSATYLAVHGRPVIAIGLASVLAILLYRAPASSVAGDAQPVRIDQRGRARRAALLILVAVAGLAVLFVADRRLFDLAIVMLKVDVLAFGGGYASVPLMLHEVVEQRHWIDAGTFMDGIALGQVTPGPIVITATFVGFQVAGLLGAVVATIGVFSPSLVILTATVPHFDRLRYSALFQRAVRGALVSFVGLLVAVAVRFGLVVAWTPLGVILAALAFTALWLKLDVLWVVLAGGAIAAIAL